MLFALKRLKEVMTVKQNVTKENETKKTNGQRNGVWV